MGGDESDTEQETWGGGRGAGREPSGALRRREGGGGVQWARARRHARCVCGY